MRYNGFHTSPQFIDIGALPEHCIPLYRLNGAKHMVFMIWTVYMKFMGSSDCPNKLPEYQQACLHCSRIFYAGSLGCSYLSGQMMIRYEIYSKNWGVS